MSPSAVIELHDVWARRRGQPSLRGITLEVREYEILGVTGAPDAGVTDLLDCISGHRRSSGGTILLRDADITGLPAHHRARLGLARVFARGGVLPSLTVLDHARAAQHARIRYGAVGGMLGSPAAVATERVVERRARDLLELLGIPQLAHSAVTGLPPALLVKAKLAAALATDPDVLLLEAPALGLSAADVSDLTGVLLRLRRDLGVTIVLVDDDVPLLVAVCDHLHVLHRGAELLQGPPQAVSGDPRFLSQRYGEEGLDGSA